MRLPRFQALREELTTEQRQTHIMASALQASNIGDPTLAALPSNGERDARRGRGPRRRGQGRGGLPEGRTFHPRPSQREDRQPRHQNFVSHRAKTNDASTPEQVSTPNGSGNEKSSPEQTMGVEEDAIEDGVEAEVCFICASPVVHNAVAPCNHRTCHICALRLRALYKTRACAHCRVCTVSTS